MIHTNVHLRGLALQTRVLPASPPGLSKCNQTERRQTSQVCTAAIPVAVSMGDTALWFVLFLEGMLQVCVGITFFMQICFLYLKGATGERFKRSIYHRHTGPCETSALFSTDFPPKTSGPLKFTVRLHICQSCYIFCGTYTNIVHPPSWSLSRTTVVILRDLRFRQMR